MNQLIYRLVVIVHIPLQFTHIIGSIPSTKFRSCQRAETIWDCSRRHLTHVPNIPASLRNSNFTLDLSFNQFSVLSTSTFQRVSNIDVVTSLTLNHNPIKVIQNHAFTSLTRLTFLDMSFCRMTKFAFKEEALANLLTVTSLDLQYNSFHFQKSSGYPSTEIGRLRHLTLLKIDVFDGFRFDIPFKSLEYLKDITFRGEGQLHLTNESFWGLRNSPIQYIFLDLYNSAYCGGISDEIFCAFRFLKGVKMDISFRCNIIPALLSLKCLQHRKLEYLILQNQIRSTETSFITLTVHELKYLLNICVKTFIASRSEIGVIRFPAYLKKPIFLACLERMDLSQNDLHGMSFFSTLFLLLSLGHIHYIDVSKNDPYGRENVNDHIGDNIIYNTENVNNHIRHYTCTSYGRKNGNKDNAQYKTENVNKLKELFQNEIFQNLTIQLSPSLQVLNISNNYIQDKAFEIHNNLRGEGLKILQARNINMYCNAVSFIFPKLEVLDISYSHCEHINDNTLENLPNLKSLTMTNSGMVRSMNRKSLTVFKRLTELSHLDLSNNEIRDVHFPEDMLESQRLSLKMLFLDRNSISSIPKVLKNFVALESLSLKFNKLLGFSKEDISILKSLKRTRIYLEGNYLSCLCAWKDSFEFIKHNSEQFPDVSSLPCRGSQVPIKDFLKDDNWRTFQFECQTSFWLVLASSLLFVSLVIFIMVVLTRKYQVHIDYMKLRLKRRWQRMDAHLNHQHFDFDVYVVYDDNNLNFVKKLCNTLTQNRIRPCVKDIDFTPGKSMADEIISFIDKSRKVLLVMSKDFLTNDWASYEIQMTLMHAFASNRKSMITLIIKDGISLEVFPNELKNIWWMIKYVRFPEVENDHEENVFWRNVFQMIKEDA